jgi:hypothetical protein
MVAKSIKSYLTLGLLSPGSYRDLREADSTGREHQGSCKFWPVSFSGAAVICRSSDVLGLINLKKNY